MMEGISSRSSEAFERGSLGSGIRVAVGFFLGLFVRLWIATLRVEFCSLGGSTAAANERFVVCFLHGKQIPLLRWGRGRSLVTLVSLSRDGWIQTGVMRSFGIRVFRGSSSRGGVEGLFSLVRHLKTSEDDAAIAVDGPKGPYGKVKPGALALAKHTRAKLLPIGMYAEKKLVLVRAWDRLEIPMPFSRVRIVEGTPVDPMTEADLERAIQDANHAAALSARA